MQQSIMKCRTDGPAVRVEIPDSEEMAAVAETFNSMVTELDKRMADLDRPFYQYQPCRCAVSYILMTFSVGVLS